MTTRPAVFPIPPHHAPGCPCDAHVEGPTEDLPCPALWDAVFTEIGCRAAKGERGPWFVHHRIEGSASTGAKVWYRWEERRG